ncbi:KilA-N domain-containing protein [Aulosira sp. FACHB-615]|uniref:KilA-N domain-containing protein n=1 Tax=Aulosira sp. FACHB-615 TaxID=2692777 RepID=UPI0016897CE5|nr:KilA-N domain-containing protein [Aulosira sp. FACHB-615]MBD2492564.1 KilA-N domain-containing protein [Aulosira sp. FACHB-615]
MLIHFWRDSEINQMAQDGQIGKYTIPKGYVNGTQMCKANGKFLADYTKLKSTKQYLQALSNDMKIIISSLVIEIQAHGSEQSTWLHPEIAVDLARWVSVEFRVWANRTLTKIIVASEVEPIPEPEPPKAIAPSHEAAQLAMILGEFAGLDKSLTAQLAVNAATAVNPALKPAADELKTAIAQTNVADDAFLNATQIGEVVGMSARAVNNWLVQSGLQYRTQDKKIPYRPTESGKQWGRMVPALARSSNQTVFQLRWLPTVTKLFQ